MFFFPLSSQFSASLSIRITGLSCTTEMSCFVHFLVYEQVSWFSVELHTLMWACLALCTAGRDVGECLQNLLSVGTLFPSIINTVWELGVSKRTCIQCRRSRDGHCTEKSIIVEMSAREREEPQGVSWFFLTSGWPASSLFLDCWLYLTVTASCSGWCVSFT